MGWDTRTGDQSWTLVNTVSNQSVRSVDFNPNKQYYLVTGCDEGCVSVWDVRSPDQALLTMRHHSHWVWSTRYNTYHDQLLLSAGSDSKVIMTSLTNLTTSGVQMTPWVTITTTPTTTTWLLETVSDVGQLLDLLSLLDLRLEEVISFPPCRST